MKFMLLGFAQSGKDTFADYVVKEYSLKFKSASMLIAEKIIMPKFPGRYNSVEECYADRVNHRAIWAKLLEEYIEDDKTRFIGNLLWTVFFLSFSCWCFSFCPSFC